jgi:two-component system, OmpR family, response regulator
MLTATTLMNPTSTTHSLAPDVTTDEISVIVVDDDADIRRLLSRYLSSAGMNVTEAYSESSLHSALARYPRSVVLLDVNLGREDGFAIAKRLREASASHAAASQRVGIIMLTSRNDTVDRVVGLELGADDYVPKPFELRELSARIKSVARRLPPPSEKEQIDAREPYYFSHFKLEPRSRSLVDLRTEESLHITTGEFDLLQLLVSNANQVMSRDHLSIEIRGREAGPFDRSIDVQIGRLRRKLGDSVPEPTIIKSIRNSGYLFCIDVSRSPLAAV